MGGSASKAARTAGAATRKYPSRIPPTTSKPTEPNRTPAQEVPVGPSVHPDPQASAAQAVGARNEAVNRDASDPDLALNERMRQFGPVQPNPTFSNSSTFNQSQAGQQATNSAPLSAGGGFVPSESSPSQSIFPNPASNPAVILLEARQKLARQAEEEFEDVGRLGKGKKGRQFLDVVTIRQVLRLRDQLGRSDNEIEENLGLQAGLVSRLGRKGIVSGSGD